MFLHDYPSDKVTGTWSKTGGTVNSLYPLTDIDDDKPWNPVIFTANPSRLILDSTSAVRLDMISFIHCNFPAGYVPVVSRGSVIGTPLTTVSIVCLGPDVDNMPANPWADLTGLAGYGNYRYTWIDLPATGTLLSLGLIRLSAVKRTILNTNLSIRDFAPGAKIRETHPDIERITDAGTQIGYSRGTRARWLSGTIQCDDGGYANLQTLTRASRGRFKPFIVIPNSGINESMFVKYGTAADAPLERTTVEKGIYTVQVDFEELGRGLAP